MSVSILRVLASRRMVVALLLGFSCGLPLLLTGSVLQAWLKSEGVSIEAIGLMALVGIPYTLKFLWSPLLDRFVPPFLGRRRGWMLLTQAALLVSIVGLGLTHPAANPWLVALVAFFVTFFSASQDIVVDAHRRETLHEKELGLGSSLYVYGYRTGMLLAGGGGLILADQIPFPAVYAVLGACLAIGMATTLLAPEPEIGDGAPATLRAAVVEPFLEFFGRKDAMLILLFVLLYKLGDSMAGTMTTPFYLDVGFTMTEIGGVVKLFGFWAVLGGLFLGGMLILRMGIYSALWSFGVLQALSTACFAFLVHTGANTWALAGVISFENLSGGMGTSAYLAFMASLTNKKFTATQYALLTSLMGVPRVLFSAPTGYMAKAFGWPAFFIACALVAVPGLLLLLRFRPWLLRADRSEDLSLATATQKGGHQ